MSPSKSKNLTPSYAVIQGLYWMYFATIMSFSGFFLLSGGFTNTQIGILAAIAGLLSAVLQPVLAGYADQPQSPSLKKLIQMLYFLQLILVIGLFLSHSLILTGLLYGSSIALLQLMTPFINSLGMESINQGHSLNFGLARGMGSVAYACICYILGIITVKAGPVSIPITVIVLTLLSLGILILFPFSKAKSDSTATNAPKSSSDSNPILFFRKYKRFSLVLLGCIFIYLSHVLLNNFNFQIALAKGGGSAEMGTASAKNCRYLFHNKSTWHAACSGYSGILRRTDFSDARMGTYDCSFCLLCKCPNGTGRRNQGAGLFHNGIYPWKRTWFFSWRNTHRPCRSTRNAALLNSLCIHWCTDRTNLC